MFYPQWLLFFYGFSGVFSINLNAANKICVSKKIQVFIAIKVMIMIVIDGYFAIYPEMSFTFYNKKFLSIYLLPFAINVILFSSNGFHLTAFLLIFLQFFKSKKIINFLSLISNSKLDPKHFFKYRKHMLRNFILVLIFFVGTLLRTLVQMRFHSILALLTTFVLLQSHLVFFAFNSFFDDMKKFIIINYEEVSDSLKQGINIKKNIILLEDIDEFIKKLQNAFDQQLTILVLNFTATIIFYVSLNKF